MIVEFSLNGQAVREDVAPDMRAVDLLRERLGLSGTKEGCGSGECGACTILVDGHSRLSCLMLAAQLEGRNVITIEGLGTEKAPHTLQEAFTTHGAVQCGYCTPGMILSAADLLAAKPAPTRDDIRKGIAGNICRCTGYVNIVEAIYQASRSLRGEKP